MKSLFPGFLGGALGALVVVGCLHFFGRTSTKGQSTESKDLTVERVKIIDQDGDIKMIMKAGSIVLYGEEESVLSIRANDESAGINFGQIGLHSSLENAAIRIGSSEDPFAFRASVTEDYGSLTLKGSDQAPSISMSTGTGSDDSGSIGTISLDYPDGEICTGFWYQTGTAQTCGTNSFTVDGKPK